MSLRSSSSARLATRRAALAPRLAACLAASTLALAARPPRPAPAGTAPRIVVGPNVQVSAALAAVNHHEVVVAAHPARADVLLACSMLGDRPGRAVNSAAYRSTDGGASWRLASVADEHFADDPTCAFGPDGAAYFVVKTNTGEGMVPGASSDTDSLHVRRSSDGGATWAPVIHSIHANDRPFLVVDTTAGPHRGRVYVAFDDHVHGEGPGHTNADFRHLVALASSADGARSFPLRAARALLDQTSDRGSASLACGIVVLSDGTVALLQHHMLTGGTNAGTAKPREIGGRLQLFRSTDGGRSLETPTRVAEVESGYNHPASRGVTASLAADPGSARFRDRLYAAWTDFGAGRGVIRMAISGDGGRTWPDRVAIGEDRAALDATPSADNFMPTVAVARDGVVGVLWYDRRAHPDDAYDAWFAASIDGGRTWLPSVRVSAAANDAARQAPAGERVATERPADAFARGTFSATGGDTAGLVADAAGRFHALWIDNRTGVQQAWTATIEVR
jgi:hypothetical protein